MIAPATVETSILLIADISGYTRFLEAVQEAHPEIARSDRPVAPAYGIVSSLLETVMARIAPSFALSQLEGDALFACRPDPHGARNAAELLIPVRSAYEAFRLQLEAAMNIFRHDCQACVLLPSLQLKFIAHRGIVITQRIAGREQLVGSAVNVAHRLLKNSITAQTGLRGYLFVTDAAADAFGLTAALGRRHAEDYSDVGQISGIVVSLETDRSEPASASLEKPTTVVP